MDLEADEAFEGGVLFVGVLEVGALFSIEPGLEMVALALDDDGVPAVPLEELFSLGGEGGEFFFGCFVSVGVEPAATSFVEDASGPGAFAVFEVVVLALVAGDAAVGLFLGGCFVQGAEHAAGVTGFVEELELEGEDEVAEFFFGAEEGVAFDVFAEATDGVVFDLVFGSAASLAPSGEVGAVEEGFEAFFFESSGVDGCR